MKGNIITLTTDWGDSDNYAAIFKAHLYRKSSDLNIVDVTHKVRNSTIADAAFLVKTMYHYYPENSIHIVDVNYMSTRNETIYRNAVKTGQSTEDMIFTHFLAFRYDDHYFLCENNGFITLFCDIDKITEIVLLPPADNLDLFNTFKAIPYYVKAAASLAQGKTLSTVGTEYDINNVERLKKPMAYLLPGSEDVIVFMAQYIDSYGNIITNLHRDLFDSVAKGRTSFIIRTALMETKKSRKISKDYVGNSQNETLFIFGHSNYLELATRFSPLGKIIKGGLMSAQFSIDFSEENK